MRMFVGRRWHSLGFDRTDSTVVSLNNQSIKLLVSLLGSYIWILVPSARVQHADCSNVGWFDFETELCSSSM